MFPLRHSRSERSLHKLKKGKSFSWASRQAKTTAPPKVDYAAFRSGLPADLHPHHPPVQRTRTTSARRAPRTAARNIKRDTILLDLSNNDLIPALDYAFAILDDDKVSIRSLPPPPPPPKMPMPILSRGSSTDSGDVLYTPSTSEYSATIPSSVRSSPPRYHYVSSPLSSSPSSSAIPSARPSPQKRSARPAISHHPTVSFDPEELSLALQEAQSTTPDLPSPSSERSVPFPPPAEPPARRVPLLLRKPRVHSAESSMDGHESLGCRSYPNSSKVSLAPRSVSSLGHHHDVFGARSTTSLHTPDAALSALLAQQPSRSLTRSPYGSLRLFSSKSRRSPIRRASTPPPSRARLGIPIARPPVPALPDVFLLGPAARREASGGSTSSLLARAVRATNAV